MTSGTMISKVVAISLFAMIFIVDHSIEAVKIVDCAKGGSSSGSLGKVNISNCNMNKDPYCTLVHGKNASIQVDFNTKKPFKKAIVSMYGKLGFVTVPFPISPSDSCKNYGVNCPSKVDEQQSLAITLPVLSLYPPVALKVRIKLTDESKRPIICLEFPIKIANQ